MTETQTISTEHGDAEILWDEQDPSTAGWFLRYSNGRQELDEILGEGSIEEAKADALAFLAREGIAVLPS